MDHHEDAPSTARPMGGSPGVPPAPAAQGLEPRTSPASWLTVWWRVIVPPLLIVLVALVNVGLHVHSYRLIGPVDELQHIDYLYKAPHVVRSGDRIGQDAMRQEACRGLDYHPFTLPACSTTAQYKPSQFQENGYNTAAVNTPLYYSVTKAAGLAIMALISSHDLVQGGRLAGGLWLAAGLLLTYAAARRLGASRWVSTAVLATVACLPAVVYPSAVISPDAATFAVGGGTLLAVLWWEERPARRWPVLALVTALGLAIKLTNVTIVAVAVLYIAFRVIPVWRSGVRGNRWVSLRAPMIAVAAMAGVAVVVAGGWLAVSSALAYGNPSDVPMNVRFAVSSISAGEVLGSLGVWLSPLAQQWASVGNPVLSDLLQRIGVVLLSGGLIGTVLLGLGAVRKRTWSLAWAILAVGTFAGPVYVLFSFYLQHVYVPPPARYGYAMAPAMAAITASVVKGRAAAAACGVVAAAAVAFSVARFFV